MHGWYRGPWCNRWLRIDLYRVQAVDYVGPGDLGVLLVVGFEGAYDIGRYLGGDLRESFYTVFDSVHDLRGRFSYLTGDC